MKRNVMSQTPGMSCKHKMRHEKEAEKQQCYFCLEEQNSVDFISCVDTVKFRLSVQVSLAHLTAGASSGSFSPLFCWNIYFPSIRHHSEEHPSIHDLFCTCVFMHTASYATTAGQRSAALGCRPHRRCRSEACSRSSPRSSPWFSMLCHLLL